MGDASQEALHRELETLSDDMRRAQLAMQTALLEIQRVEDRRKEIEGLLRGHMSVDQESLKANNAMLQGELAELRSALSHAADHNERTVREKEVASATLRMQLDDMHHGLAHERLRNSLLQQDLQHSGYPVVGLELSEGAPYDIAGVWVVSVARGGAADKAGIRKGDVISEVGGISVPTRESFRRIITGVDGPPTKPGHQLSFRIHREDAGTSKPISMNVMVTLGWSARKPEGRRSITVTRTDLGPSRGTPQKRVMSSSPHRRENGGPGSSGTPGLRNTTDRSISPCRLSRFL